MHKRSRAAYEAGEAAHAPYALYGTPLPAYDPDARDDGSYVPIWKQEVTDERGRKRLHGAFTGGFSAGYFNTVGSKEGWAPSTFVSSRANRAKDQTARKQQRAEDFMDDEDLAEHAESQKLETVGGFAGLGSTGSGRSDRGIFSDLFRNSGESMGMKLLQRMGWRQGQGIGPMVKRKARGDANGELHLFAPEDTKMVSLVGKTDRNGLGFAGQDRLESTTTQGDVDEDTDDRDARILQTKSTRLIKKPKKPGMGAFRIDVLDDNGSDDEDPYAIGPQISYNRVVDGIKKKKKSRLIMSNSSSRELVRNQNLTPQEPSTVASRGCHNGRPPLEGFVLSMATLTIRNEALYAPPQVPSGWKSSKIQADVTDSAGTFQSTADGARASSLDEKSRAKLLGEQQLPGKSIFDFMKPAVRDRLVAASGRTNLPQARGEGAPAGFEASESDQRKTLWDSVPQLDKRTAEAALHRGSTGWMPYSEDEEKRGRYRYFLELSAGRQSNLPVRPTTFSVDDWSKELLEFAQAATVFKPVSGLMAARFTSSNATPKLASDAPDQEDRMSQPEDPQEKAAEMGMFGPLTRTVRTFIPTRLICKRFGVPPPSIESDTPTASSSAPDTKRLQIVSQASIETMLQESRLSTQDHPVARRVATSIKIEASEPVDAEKNDALEADKPGEAVFRAVFGSDSEDE